MARIKAANQLTLAGVDALDRDMAGNMKMGRHTRFLLHCLKRSSHLVYVCMCVCVNVCVYVCIYVFARVYVCLCVCVRVGERERESERVCVTVCVNSRY